MMCFFFSPNRKCAPLQSLALLESGTNISQINGIVPAQKLVLLQIVPLVFSSAVYCQASIAEYCENNLNSKQPECSILMYLFTYRRVLFTQITHMEIYRPSRYVKSSEGKSNAVLNESRVGDQRQQKMIENDAKTCRKYSSHNSRNVIVPFTSFCINIYPLLPL